MSGVTPKYIDVPAIGAGIVRISTSPTACGTSVGVAVGVSWGRNGDAGGVVAASDIPAMINALEAVRAEIQRRGGEASVYRQITRERHAEPDLTSGPCSMAWRPKCPACGSREYHRDGDWDNETGEQTAAYMTCRTCGHSGPIE